MKVIHGDIFEKIANENCDGSKKAIVITTNGEVNQKGQAVMGKGIALTAKEKYIGIENALGHLLQSNGNNVYYLGRDNVLESFIFSFPTKHSWRDKSDIKLIKKSCLELREKTAALTHVFLPPVGCGNGRLNLKDVLDEISPLLPEDKFIMCVPDFMKIPDNYSSALFSFQFTQEEVNELTNTLMFRLDGHLQGLKAEAMKAGNEPRFKQISRIYDINQSLFSKISNYSKDLF